MDQEELVAHIEIRQALARYCQGIDRGDAALIASAYHPGAPDHHGTFDGTAEQFAAYVVAKFDQPGIVGQHHITNVYAEIAGARARVESYFMVMRPQVGAAGEDQLVFAGGRYLDRFEQRAGKWLIAERTVVMDWYRPPLSGAAIAREARVPAPGRREQDPSWEFFAAGRGAGQS